MTNNQVKQDKILQLEKEMIPMVRRSFGPNAVSLMVNGGCGTFEMVPGWSDYDLLVFVRDMKNIPKLDFSALEKKYGIAPIQLAVKPIKSFHARVSGSPKADRFVDTLWLLSMKLGYSRVLAGKDIVSVVPPLKKLLRRDLGCELRSHYLHETNMDPLWSIPRAKNPKRWINCVVSLSHFLLLAKGVKARKEEIPDALNKYYPDFTGTNLVRQALKIRSGGKIPSVNSAIGKKAKKILTDFLEIYRRYLFDFRDKKI